MKIKIEGQKKTTIHHRQIIEAMNPDEKVKIEGK
jgi:hypothetical protein